MFGTVKDSKNFYQKCFKEQKYEFGKDLASVWILVTSVWIGFNFSFLILELYSIDGAIRVISDDFSISLLNPESELYKNTADKYSNMVSLPNPRTTLSFKLIFKKLYEKLSEMQIEAEFFKNAFGIPLAKAASFG